MYFPSRQVWLVLMYLNGHNDVESFPLNSLTELHKLYIPLPYHFDSCCEQYIVPVSDSPVAAIFNYVEGLLLEHLNDKAC
jgi:hypothetical protein